MGNTVRTVGPPAAPNDRGSPRTAWHQIDWETGRADSPKPALADLPSGQGYTYRSIGLSGMRGNSHVPFLGEGAMVTPPPYPTLRFAPASGSS
jgi:hypothetical protein